MKTNNQSAFPTMEVNKYVGLDGKEDGLTKREYFAARAMQGLLSNPEWMKEYKGEKYLMQSDIVAEVALKTADNLLSKLSSEDES